MAEDEERASITTVRRSPGRWCGGPPPPWRALCAEAAGTALLVSLTCLATCAEPPLTLLQRALASGLIVAVVVQCFEHVSGAQLNPAVTLARVVLGRARPLAGAAEGAAQLLGAAGGAAAARLLARGPLPHGYCGTKPADGMSVYKAVATEALLGACLALANCASWDARNRCLRDSWPLRIGFTVAALSLVAGDVTGASMNPARSLAPALWSGDWTQHWVYWAGPVSGAALAAALYRVVWRAPLDAAPDAAPREARACKAQPAA